MVLDTLITNSPFITGIALFVSVFMGFAILRLPASLSYVLGVPFVLVIVNYYIPVLQPLVAIISGFIIAFFFLRIVSR